MVGKNLALTVEKAQEVLHIIEGLYRGDRIFVVWYDACRVTNDPDVRPDYYSTRKETQGTVYDCLPDPEYPHIFYLIVSGETTSGKPDYYDSIPIAWIAKIEKLEAVPSRHPKSVTKITPQSYQIERLMVYKHGELVEDTGGIDKVPKKWTRKGHVPRKFVERTTKLVH